jgi:hypothetical protein
MYLSYGKVDLKIVRFLECSRTPEYDQSGTDYLWTRYRISVEAIYSANRGLNWPYAVAYTGTTPLTATVGRDDGTFVNPIVDTTSNPINTDRSLIHALSIPRRKLVLSFGLEAGNQIWISSPIDTLPCCMISGPIPIDVSVQEIRGEAGMFLVRFTVETALNFCGSDGKQTDILLSNRWTASTSADENFFETRTFKGRAIFRSDLVHDLHLAVDLWRLNLIPPMPVNCKRHIIDLTVGPDGYTYDYEIQDVEQEVPYLDQPTYIDAVGGLIGGVGLVNNRPKRNVTSIDAVVRRNYTQPGSKTMLTSAINEIRSAMWSMGQFSNVLETATGGKSGELTKAFVEFASGGTAVTARMALGMAEIGFASATAAISTANEVLPVFTEEVTVEVRGNRYAKKADLQFLAFSVAFGQLTSQEGAMLVPLQAQQQAANGVIGAISQLPVGTNSAGVGALGLAGGITAANSAFINTQTSVINSVTNAFVKTINRLVPTTHVIDLEFDVFKKRVKVTVQQEYSGLIDWVMGRQGLGRQALFNPLPDIAVGGQWPAFFVPKSERLKFTVDSVVANASGLGAINALSGIGSVQPAPLKDVLNLIGSPSAQVAGIGPPFDNTAWTGSLLNIVAADLLKPCSPVYQPMTPEKLIGVPNFPQSPGITTELIGVKTISATNVTDLTSTG